MNKKAFYLSIALCIPGFLMMTEGAFARKFRSTTNNECKTEKTATEKDCQTPECGPFWRFFSGSATKNVDHCEKKAKAEKCKKSKDDDLSCKVGLDWTQTTTQNLETAIGYFFSVIPEEQEELRRSLKQKESKTKAKIKGAETIGDQNYREAEFLSFKLAMVANWHQAAQEGLKSAMNEKDEELGGIAHRDFRKAKREAQKELLYEIYAMLDGVCPDPKKPVDHEKLHDKIHDVVDEVFSSMEKTRTKKHHPQPKEESRKEPETTHAPSKAQRAEEEERMLLEVKVAKFKEDLENAQNTLNKARSENLELRKDLESERKKRTEENIKQKIEQNKFEAEKNRLSMEKTKLEEKVSKLSKKRGQLESKIDGLEGDLKKEATGKTMSSIELEKARKQKESLEKKLEKRKSEIVGLRTQIEENNRKQVNLQVQVAQLEKEKAKIKDQSRNLKKEVSELKTGKPPAMKMEKPLPVRQKPISRPEPKKTPSLATPAPLPSPAEPDEKDLSDIEKTARRLDALNSRDVSRKHKALEEAESLFDEFPEPGSR